MTEGETTAGLHYFIVVNPRAGQQEAATVRETVAAHLDAPGSSHEVYEFDGGQHLRQVVGEAVGRGAHCVVAAGGDGTVSAVADALVGKDVLLGILPAGTGNSLARVLGIPGDLEAAAGLLLGNAGVRQIDALAVGDRYAVLNVSAGLTAFAQQQTGRLEKQVLGRAAYGLETVKGVLDFAPTGFRMVVDGKRQEAEAMDLTVANGLVLGGLPLDWGPAERFADGQADGYLLSAQGPLAAGVLLAELIMDDAGGVQARHLAIRDEIYVETERPLPVQVDGEMVGETPVTIRLLPEALRVLVPARRAGPGLT